MIKIEKMSSLNLNSTKNKYKFLDSIIKLKKDQFRISLIHLSLVNFAKIKLDQRGAV